MSKETTMILGGLEFLLFKFLVGGAAVGTAAATVTWIVKKLLSLGDIRGWFRTKQTILEKDADNLVFLVKDEVEKGKIRVMQGILNTKTDTVVTSQGYETERLDESLKNEFGGQSTIVCRAA
jgi:hypothetical protein